MKKLTKVASTTAGNLKGKLIGHANSDGLQNSPSELSQQQSDLSGVGPVPSNISTASQNSVSRRNSAGNKTTQSSLSVHSGSIAEKDGAIDPALFTVPPEVVALPPGERLETLDNRIAEIKWRLENEEIILDRLNKLNLKDRSAKYVKDVGGQKAIVRSNTEKLNVSLAEHCRMRDEAIVSQERGNLASDLRDSRLQRQALEARIKELESQVQLQTEQLADTKTQAEAGRAKLNQHVISLNAQVDELTQENIKLEHRLGEVEEGSQTCAEHTETIDGLRAELQDALAELDQAMADKAALDVKCEALQARVAALESADAKQESTARELSDARLELAALAAKVGLVETLQSQNERLAQSEGMKDERIQHLTRELEAARLSSTDVATLNMKLHMNSQEATAELRRELNAKNGIIKEQHSTIESLRRTIQADEGDLQKELASKAEELENARTHSLRLDNEVAEAKAANAKLTREVEKLRDELARTQQDFKAASGKAEGWAEERQAKDKQINELTITLREFMAVKDKEMGELNAVRQREQQDAVASKEREMEKALQEKAALQAELETIRTTQESQARKQKDIQTRMRELEVNLRRELSNSQDLNTKLIKTLQEKADLMAKVEELEEQREMLARQIAEKPKKRGLFTSFSQTRLNE